MKNNQIELYCLVYKNKLPNKEQQTLFVTYRRMYNTIKTTKKITAMPSITPTALPIIVCMFSENTKSKVGLD